MSIAKHAVFIRVLCRFALGVLALCINSVIPTYADVKSVMPDYYAEPGLNPFRDPSTTTPNEIIDPFSGSLHLSHVDTFIPGNGGLDIKIQRVYNSNNAYLSRAVSTFNGPYPTLLAPRTATGVGWTMHFGRVHRSLGLNMSICSPTDGTLNNTTLDNPVLELPDGSQQILFVNATGFSAPWITKEQWVAYCVGSGTGLLVISPDGTKYTMDYRKSGGTTYGTVNSAWYTTRIEDRNGNWLNISYNTTAQSIGIDPIFSQITSSDGRNVSFSYANTTNALQVLLSSISANGQTWSYNYAPATAPYNGEHFQLTSVTRPDGLSWRYSYHSLAVNTPGDRLLNSVTYPHGATTSYDYGHMCLNSTAAANYQCSGILGIFYSLVVNRKTNGGRDVTSGTWTYDYSPTSTEDVTTVTFPGGRHVYKHFNTRQVYGSSTFGGKRLWQIGLLKEKLTYDGGSLVNREIYTWDAPYLISNELYIRPPYDGSDGYHPTYFDNDVWAPVLVRKDIVRDGGTYTTTYGSFDSSYNPQTISESGQASRTTSVSYFPRDANQNIVRLVKDEVSSGRTIARTFDSNGNPTVITRNGVRETFNYSSAGDVASRTNARGQTWTYSSYDRGIPQVENHPAGVTIRRSVNSTGSIGSETNGRGGTTTYSYNGMNLPTSINPPTGSNISISWSSSGRTLTRGSYSQAISFDGFGRPSAINTSGVTQNINYNALGFKTFESYYSATSGDSYSPDVLGRVTAINHADGTNRRFSYSGNSVGVTNERGNTTTYSYRAYGDPDSAEDKVLMRIDSPEGVNTVFSRNALGLPTSISQGGVTRNYSYNSDNFLVSESNPETGTTSYGRDAVGNMTSRSVGGSGTTSYSYDGLNRLTAVNYPNGAPSVSYQYDGNDNLTSVSSSAASRSLTYDANDNLRTERLTVNGLTFNAAYAYNSLDHLTSITYPSLRQVRYAPDSLGRPGSAAPYVTSASYHPNGVPRSLNFANGQTATLAINNRQWISNITTRGAAYAQDLSYTYDGVANVTGITNSLDSSDSKSLSYDGVDRLVNAGTASISYDTTDNITNLRSTAGSLNYNYSSNRLSSVSGFKSYNFSYDSNGNVTSNGHNTFDYDGASNLRTVTGATSATYAYDGKNQRVLATRNGQDIYFFYGLNGLLLGEYDAQGTWVKEYAYLGTKLAAMVENVPDIPPSAPASLAVPASSDTGNYTISWGAASGTLTRYELQEATTADFSNATLAYSGTALSWPAANKIDGTYYYRVRACNGTACSAYITGTNGVMVIIPPPSAPSNILVPTISTGIHTVSWTAATGTVIRYELQQDTDSGFTAPILVYSGMALSSSVTVSQTGTYYYRVRACNGSACSAFVDGANGVNISALAPSIPQSLTIPATSSGSYPISWGASLGVVTHYELLETAYVYSLRGYPTQVAYMGPDLSVQINKTVISGRFEITPGTFDGNGNYGYLVRACNGSICSGYRSAANTIVVTLPIPTIPSRISIPTRALGGTPKVSWAASNGTVTHYELYFAKTRDFSNPNRIFCVGSCPPYLGIKAYAGTGVSFTDTGLITGTYYYRVRACNVDACSNFRTGRNGVVVP